MARRTKSERGRSEAARRAYAREVARAFREPAVVLGPSGTRMIRGDAKHLCFVLARYKFCARMLEGQRNVLEVGCGDGIGLPVVAQAVGRIVAIDNEPTQIADDRRRLAFLTNCSFVDWDLLVKPCPGRFSAAYLIDMIEHIHPNDETRLMRNLCASLETDAVVVVGTPNVEANRFASPQSRACHVNLKGHVELRASLLRWFRNVFLFSMNDEVVHTGFYPMAHYLMALAVGLRRR